MNKTKKTTFKYDPISMENVRILKLSYLERTVHRRLMLKSILFASLIALFIIALIYFNFYYFFYEINN